MKGGFAVKITSSYAVEIKKQKMLDNTIKIYREAVSFLIGCFNKEWSAIQVIDKTKPNSILLKSWYTQLNTMWRSMILTSSFISSQVTCVEPQFKQR